MEDDLDRRQKLIASIIRKGQTLEALMLERAEAERAEKEKQSLSPAVLFSDCLCTSKEENP